MSALDRAITIGGLILGALITYLATRASLKSQMKSQQEELRHERDVRIRSAWKGLYSELSQIKIFLGSPPGPSSIDLDLFVSLPTQYLNDIHPYLSLCSDDMQDKIRSFGSLVNLHNGLVEYGVNQEKRDQHRAGESITARRQEVLNKLNELFPIVENFLYKDLKIQRNSGVHREAS